MPVTVRVINRMNAPHVYYNTKIKPVVILPGKEATFEMSDGDYETANAISLAKCGPEVVLVEGADPRAEALAETEETAELRQPRRRGRPPRRLMHG